jgi:hypothetical protein
METKMTTAIIVDKQGNNYAVICPNCARPFVYSEFLDAKKGGRDCPHCDGYRHSSAENKVTGGSKNFPIVRHTVSVYAVSTYRTDLDLV